MTNRKTGDLFETYLINLFNIGGTHASGASLDDADLKDDYILIECKVKSTVKGVSISPSLIDKVSEQAVKWRREWAIASRTAKGDFITLPAGTFAEIYDGFKRQKSDN
jgi:hypothetical protein